MKLTACLIICSCLLTAATAQKLPTPSRTVYKCGEGEKIHYSDSPCIGATKIDVEPTRGLDSSSGKTRIGSDVRREQFHEAFADAIKPLTGMDAKQLDASGRRMKLASELQKKCRQLDSEIPIAESTERQATAGDDLKSAQVRLFNLRSTYRQTGC